MIHYHGLPIWPTSAAARAVGGGHAFVSFHRPEQLALVLEVASSFAVDNGAFSAWRSGEPITDWEPYYEWVAELHRYPQFDFAVIPDVIDGDEMANDALIEAWPWQASGIGAPVWHMHENLSRLERLAMAWPRVCIGSSGEYARVGSDAWWRRMVDALNLVCDRSGRPVCKLHGLRMLNPAIFSRLPLASADSTNIARTVGMDAQWRGANSPSNKEVRAMVMRERIEASQAQTLWQRNGGLFT